MSRLFNTSGVCRPDDHYMLPAEPRVAGLRRLIDEKLYFVVHAPRQVGKSTSLRALAESLTAEGKYAALRTSCELGQLIRPSLEDSIGGILANLHIRAGRFLPEQLRPSTSRATPCAYRISPPTRWRPSTTSIRRRPVRSSSPRPRPWPSS